MLADLERHRPEDAVGAADRQRAQRQLRPLALLVLVAGCPAPVAPTAPPVKPPTPVVTAPAEPPCLAAPALIDLGTSSIMGLAAADLDGDRAVDLLVLHDVARGNGSYVTALTVYLGDGDGGFRAAGSNDVGFLAVTMAIADIDEDGRLDVVLPQNREKALAILLGAGGGALAAPKQLATARKPSHVEIADLDGDGHLDLVVASQEHLQSFLGKGDGTFKGGKPYPVGQAPDWPVVTQLDGDGVPDLFVPFNDDASFEVLRGTGHGGFEPVLSAASCGSPSSPRTGDLDGDGTADVVYGCFQASQPGAEVRLVRGSNVETSQIDSSPTEALELGEFTGDRALDLVTMGRTEAFAPTTLRVHPGNGDGSFAAPITESLDGELGDPVAADVDGDGHLDLVGSYKSGGQTSAIAVFAPLVTSGDRCAPAARPAP